METETSSSSSSWKKPPNSRKSWSELKAIVNDLRLKFASASLSSAVPSNITFRTMSDGRVRIYFLSAPPPNSWEMTLLYTDISPADAPSTDKLTWKILLDQTVRSITTKNSFSREIQLLRERKRLLTWGITSFELHKPSGKIVFPVSGTFYQCFDTGFICSPLFPTELRICQTWSPIDPQICPQNSDLVAYVCGGDIYVTHTISGHGERLTYAHDGRRKVTDDPLTAGTPSYVMQEEFGRYQGYWWQPNSDDGIYRIVYEEVDQSDVCLIRFPSSQSVGGEYDEYRFPRAGTANAKSKLKLVEFVLSETLQISNIIIRDLECPLSITFPWLEYIVRVGWTPDSKHVWAQLLNRTQQRLDLVLIPLDNFCETYNLEPLLPVEPEMEWKGSNASISPMQVVYTQTSATWINIHDLLHFLEFSETHIKFLWASEESGFRHLYTIKSSFDMLAVKNLPTESGSDGGSGNGTNGIADVVDKTINGTVDPEPLPVQEDLYHSDVVFLKPRVLEKVVITSGEWEVVNRNIWVDIERDLIYFLGMRETPLEKHLYAVSLRQPNHIRLLTEKGFSFSVDFNDTCTMAVQSYCNITTLPACEVLKVTHTCPNFSVDGIKITPMGHIMEGGPTQNQQYCPLILSPCLSNGEIIYAMVFKPHNFTTGVKYPTVLNVYGGPDVQTVSNTFKGMRQLRMHMLAAQGYCVISVDSRGSRHRGVNFESHIRGRMGTVELADQVEVLKTLDNQLGFIDMSRVAIHGWSYGGYLSLMGLIQYPEIFKLSIAGAPVTNWEYYDTGYTERYMDLPENNKQGYSAGSVLSYIHKFPEESNRLLIIHGLIDENVHFYHTSQLINCLIKANKPYQLQVYPNERHSLRNLEASKHYETTLLSFLQNYL